MAIDVSKLTEQHRQLFYKQGKEDFWFFCRGILGMNRLREKPHKEMCDLFQEWTESGYTYGLWLWPRETLKSTVFTQAGVVWRLIRNPEERILITNSKLDNAERFLRWIKLQFEANPMLRWVYGDMTTDEWLKGEIRVKGYNTDAKEASVEVASIDASVVSRHYTLIVADDLVDRSRVGTPERVNETILYYNDIQDLLTLGGQMCFIGTRWAEWDLYQHLLDEHPTDPNDERYDPTWQIIIRQLIELDENGVPQSIFPDPEVGYPKHRIARLVREKRHEFYSQYMNSPKSVSTIMLPEPLTFDSLKEVPPGIGYITFDPAISEKRSADERAIVVTYQSADDHLWVVEAQHGRWGVDLTLERLFHIYSEWKDRGIRWVGVESSVASQKLWLNLINEAGRKRGIYLPIQELKTGNTADAKRTRILQLEPYMAAGKYHVLSSLTGLLEQLRKWPGVQHDDIIDAAAYVFQLKRPGPWMGERKITTGRSYRAVSKTGYY